MAGRVVRLVRLKGRDVSMGKTSLLGEEKRPKYIFGTGKYWPQKGFVCEFPSLLRRHLGWDPRDKKEDQALVRRKTLLLLSNK